MKTGFISLHPIVSILYYLSILIFSMLCIHPISLIIILIGVMAYNIITTNFSFVLKNTKFFLFICLFIIILNPLVNQRGITFLFKIFDRRITLEALIYGLLMALSLINIISLFISYNKVIDNHKFLYIFSKFLSKTAFLITMTMRYIPLLKKRAYNINLIHQTNSNMHSKHKLVGKIKNTMNVLSILTTWSLENAVITSQSMRSRGYGLVKRTSYASYKFTYEDIIILILELIAISFVLFMRMKGHLYLNIYPVLDNIKFDFSLFISNFALFLIVFLPIIIDGKEYFKWHFTI